MVKVVPRFIEYRRSRRAAREIRPPMMRNRFRPSIILTFALGAVLALSVIPAAGQAPAYRAPRTADGKPNLNGIWQALNEAYWDIEGHAAAPGPVMALGASAAVPPGLGIVEGGPIPYQPAAAAQKKENFEKRLTLDPEIKCYLPGVPRANYMPYPFQIIQSPKYIMMVYTYASAVRTIYMDDHKEAPADSWMGWSNGRWEGETLVVDTTGFNDQTWFDRAGKLPQRCITRRRALYSDGPRTICFMKRPSRTRKCSRGRGR